jgi:hypothetical protein
MQSYQQYKGRRVAKIFPHYGDEPFSGAMRTQQLTFAGEGSPLHVRQCDGMPWAAGVVVKALDNAKDGLPFFVGGSEAASHSIS